jgi:hypothetical protein
MEEKGRVYLINLVCFLTLYSPTARPWSTVLHASRQRSCSKSPSRRAINYILRIHFSVVLKASSAGPDASVLSLCTNAMIWVINTPYEINGWIIEYVQWGYLERYGTYSDVSETVFLLLITDRQPKFYCIHFFGQISPFIISSLRAIHVIHDVHLS